jgi:hypothetical protein
MTYEMPLETGEQRLQRLRDRQHVWTQRGFVAAAFAGLVLWAWQDGLFEEGWSWSFLWLPALLIVYLLVEGVLEAILAPVGWLLGAIFRPIFRPLSSRGYSYYDEDEREELENPTPDYSRAERIPEDYR